MSVRFGLHYSHLDCQTFLLVGYRGLWRPQPNPGVLVNEALLSGLNQGISSQLLQNLIFWLLCEVGKIKNKKKKEFYVILKKLPSKSSLIAQLYLFIHEKKFQKAEHLLKKINTTSLYDRNTGFAIYVSSFDCYSDTNVLLGRVIVCHDYYKKNIQRSTCDTSKPPLSLINLAKEAKESYSETVSTRAQQIIDEVMRSLENIKLPIKRKAVACDEDGGPTKKHNSDSETPVDSTLHNMSMKSI